MKKILSFQKWPVLVQLVGWCLLMHLFLILFYCFLQPFGAKSYLDLTWSERMHLHFTAISFLIYLMGGAFIIIFIFFSSFDYNAKKKKNA